VEDCQIGNYRIDLRERRSLTENVRLVPDLSPQKAQNRSASTTSNSLSAPGKKRDEEISKMVVMSCRMDMDNVAPKQLMERKDQ